MVLKFLLQMIRESYGDLFYTPKSLPGCFCSVILLTAKNKAMI